MKVVEIINPYSIAPAWNGIALILCYYATSNHAFLIILGGSSNMSEERGSDS